MSPMYPGAISFRSRQSVLFNQILEADSQEAESQLACNPLLKTAESKSRQFVEFLREQ